MKAAHKSKPCNEASHEASSSREIFQSPQGPREISNLESTIYNFENDYPSPSKKERTSDEPKQKNFVRKIVEAFEAKYKIYNDSKTAQKIPKSPEENTSSGASMLESWKRRSRILYNPFKTDSTYSKLKDRSLRDECDESALSAEERIFHTWNKNRLIRRRLRELEKSKSLAKSKMILSAFGRKASGLELCSTFLHSSSDSSSTPNCFTRAELMRKVDLSDSAKSFSPDKIKTIRIVGPYMTSSEEAIFTLNDSLPTTSSLIDDSLKSEHNSMLSEILHVDESPKVVGAFLKESVDVENTFIDWIPITGKRLPRKKSIKKLLCSLTSGKLVKRFSSEKNLSEESRESQDSEYNERSCSSMSLTSLIPIAEALRLQDSSYFEFNRRSSLRTFKSKNKSNEASCDTYRSAEDLKGKRLLLTEVPRENVKLDLGPSYPTLSQMPRFLSPVVNEHVPRLPANPCVAKFPKNPFDTSTKIDPLTKLNSSRVYYNSNESSSVIIKNDLYEVEFRRSCSDLSSSNVYSSSSSVTNHYDVPRRLSKSENEILWKSKLNSKKEPIYDIPWSHDIVRPRSKIYDDVSPLKRKIIYVETKTNLNTRCLARCDMESHHAITKPIDTRIYMNTQV